MFQGPGSTMSGMSSSLTVQAVVTACPCQKPPFQNATEVSPFIGFPCAGLHLWYKWFRKVSLRPTRPALRVQLEKEDVLLKPTPALCPSHAKNDRTPAPQRFYLQGLATLRWGLRGRQQNGPGFKDLEWALPGLRGFWACCTLGFQGLGF